MPVPGVPIPGVPMPGGPQLAQTPAPPAAPAAATPFKAANDDGTDGAEKREGAPEGDFDDDDMENSLSLAAIEAELKPKVLETFDNVADAYKRLRRLQDQDIGFKLKNTTLSPAQERRYKKLKDDIVAEVKSLRLNQARINSLVEQLYDITHKIEGNSVPVVDEWCCGYVKGIALDPVGWQPLIDAWPDWFEVIHLYGTNSGWERLKELVDAHEDSVTRHQAFVDRIAPAARNIHAYWLARRASRERLRQLNKTPDPGRNDPCPCGSGKKFKRCHGAPDVALH